MTQDHLMTFLAVIVFSGITLFAGFQLLKKWLPQHACEPFESFKEFLDFYKEAVIAIRQLKWLYLLPLIFALSTHLIRIITLLLLKPQIPDPIGGFERSIFRLFLQEIDPIQYKLAKTINMLDYGFFGAFAGSMLFLGFYFICSLTYRAEINKLSAYVNDDHITSLLFFKKILKFSVFVLCPIVIFVFISKYTEANSLPLLLLGAPGLWIWGLLSLSLVSLVEGFLLFSLEDVLKMMQFDFKHNLNRSFGILKPLFFLNMLIVVISSLPSFFTFPNTAASLLADGSGTVFNSNHLFFFSSLAFYINTAFSFLIVCAPFFLIIGNDSVIEALKNNFIFIGNHLMKYVIFTVSGVLLLFVSDIGLSILINLFDPFSYYAMGLEVIRTTLIVFVAVIFYIAIFGFFLKSQPAS